MALVQGHRNSNREAGALTRVLAVLAMFMVRLQNEFMAAMEWVCGALGVKFAAPRTAEPVDADDLSIMQAVRLVGGAVITIAVVVLVVNEVLTVQAINNTSGPFAPVIDSLGTTGVAAMTLLVIGLIVVAANQIMGFMGGGF